jgi:hypothetical protein
LVWCLKVKNSLNQLSFAGACPHAGLDNHFIGVAARKSLNLGTMCTQVADMELKPFINHARPGPKKLGRIK